MNNSTFDLAVLVVDHDRARLAKTCGWLLAKGFDVTTRSTGLELIATVRELRPAIVFIDVLVPELESRKLRQFLQHCHASAGPQVIVHTHLLPKILRAVVDTRLILGVVRPTDDADEFSRQFDALVAPARAEGPPRATSGTHRIDVPDAPSVSSERRRVG